MKLLSFYLICLWQSAALYSQTITIGTGGDFPTLEAAESQMDPGDTVVILDGIHTMGAQFLTINGTLNDPIVIRAENTHAAVLQGGNEAIHLTNCSYVKIIDLIIEEQTGNGINIDDGGDYTTPTHHITISNCIFREMQASGNNDLLKLSGLDDFTVEHCQFLNGGGGGSGIDMVGCHHGIIQDNVFDSSGTSGIQAKGGTQYILIQRNLFKDIDQRAVNLGGSTGLEFFRPPLSNPIVNAFEAADLDVFSNIFIRSWSPIAYVGCVRVKVYNNTIYDPLNWVIRILQETTVPGFLTCADNEFRNNVIYLPQDLTEVNTGPNTDPGSFIFTNNLWFNATSGNWAPILPVVDSNQIIANPLFTNHLGEDFTIPSNSPCVGNGKILNDPQTDFVQNYFDQPPSIGAYEGSNLITSVPYIIQNDEITIYPNPSANSITLDGDFSEADIEIINQSGNTLHDYSSATAPVTILLNGYAPGIYFLRITSNLHPNLLTIRRIVIN